MSRVLVTGSLGYIGSVLMPYLKEKGYQPKGYDIGFFRNCTLYHPQDGDYVMKDVKNISDKDLQDVDTVVHLAAISNDPFGNLTAKEVYNPTRTYSFRLANMCKRKNIRFLFASSCSVYGKAKEELLTEESEANPQTPYSLNKLQIEQDLKSLADKNFSPIMMRFATAYGMSPRMRFDIVVNMLTATGFLRKKIVLNSDGKAWRPFVHVLDICKSIKHAIDSKHDEGYLVLNVGATSENYQILDVAEMTKDSIPGATIEFLNKKKELSQEEELIKDRKVQDGVDTRDYKVSFEKIKKTFNGFKCDWILKKGVKSMLKDMEKIGLAEEDLKSNKFYRLQRFEYLFSKKQITKNITWK